MKRHREELNANTTATNAHGYRASNARDCIDYHPPLQAILEDYRNARSLLSLTDEIITKSNYDRLINDSLDQYNSLKVSHGDTFRNPIPKRICQSSNSMSSNLLTDIVIQNGWDEFKRLAAGKYRRTPLQSKSRQNEAPINGLSSSRDNSSAYRYTRSYLSRGSANIAAAENLILRWSKSDNIREESILQKESSSDDRTVHSKSYTESELAVINSTIDLLRQTRKKSNVTLAMNKVQMISIDKLIESNKVLADTNEWLRIYLNELQVSKKDGYT